VLESFRKTVSEMAWAEEGQVELVQAQRPNNAGLIGAAALFNTASIIQTDDRQLQEM